MHPIVAAINYIVEGGLSDSDYEWQNNLIYTTVQKS